MSNFKGNLVEVREKFPFKREGQTHPPFRWYPDGSDPNKVSQAGKSLSFEGPIAVDVFNTLRRIQNKSWNDGLGLDREFSFFWNGGTLHVEYYDESLGEFFSDLVDTERTDSLKGLGFFEKPYFLSGGGLPQHLIDEKVTSLY